MVKEKAWSLFVILIQRYPLTIFNGNLKCTYFQWVYMGFFNRIRADPGFVSPVRSDPGFVSPIRSDPIRSVPIRLLSTACNFRILCDYFELVDPVGLTASGSKNNLLLFIFFLVQKPLIGCQFGRAMVSAKHQGQRTVGNRFTFSTFAT